MTETRWSWSTSDNEVDSMSALLCTVVHTARMSLSAREEGVEE